MLKKIDTAGTQGLWNNCFKRIIRPNDSKYLWGYGSAGRALGWQPRGQGFESPYLHQT